MLTGLLEWMYGVMPMTIRFGHPVFPYLQRSSESGTLRLNGQGRVKRRPPRPPLLQRTARSKAKGRDAGVPLRLHDPDPSIDSLRAPDICLRTRGR